MAGSSLVVALLLALSYCGASVTAMTRRAASAAATSLLAGGLCPQQAQAATKGGVQWSIDLPESFSITRQLSSVVRVRTETVLAADDVLTGAQAKLLLLPFGQQAGGSLSSDEQLELATFFFGAGGSDELKRSGENVGSIMCASAARSPSVVRLSQAGSSSVRVATDTGRRYVRYGYVSDRCNGEIDDGECLGSVSKRRTLATVTMSSVSQYRTNTERQRMRELGQERNVQVLWLLTLSAPEGAYAGLQLAFEKAASSFTVPDVSLAD